MKTSRHIGTNQVSVSAPAISHQLKIITDEKGVYED